MSLLPPSLQSFQLSRTIVASFRFRAATSQNQKKNPSNQYSNTLTIEERVMNRMIANNTLSSDSDENEISLYIITICSNNQAMRIKNVMTKDKMS